MRFDTILTMMIRIRTHVTSLTGINNFPSSFSMGIIRLFGGGEGNREEKPPYEGLVHRFVRVQPGTSRQVT